MTIEKDFCKEALLEIERLLHEPGREIVEEGDFLAFKAPVPFIDWVYGNISSKTIQKAREFFGSKPFKWRVLGEQDPSLLVERGFKRLEFDYEMEINLRDRDFSRAFANIEVLPARSPESYSRWVAISSAAWNQDPSIWDQFFAPWVKTGRFTPYLAFFDGTPAATALSYDGDRGVSLWAIGTLSDYRHRGLGTAVTCACLQEAKNKSIDRALLYSSEMGKTVYEKIGFRLRQIIREYSSS